MNNIQAALIEKLRAGGYVSGQALSSALGITRAAIWKQMEALRALGVEIEAAPRMGYRLKTLPDRLLPALIAPALHTRLLGKDIHYLETVDSTNNYAKTLAQKGCAAGTLVIAEAQSLGRGRLNRSWCSPSCTGVWMSAVLRPQIPPAEMPRITLIAALAVRDAILATCGVSAGIKWPNDVLIGERKCCGILVDMGGHWERLDYVVLGIGVNVRKEAVPPDLPQATSLDAETGKRIERLDVCSELINALDRRLGDWLEFGFAPQMEEYCACSVTLGKQVRVTSGETVISGVVEAFDELGMICLRLPDGSLQRIASGDVSLR